VHPVEPGRGKKGGGTGGGEEREGRFGVEGRVWEHWEKRRRKENRRKGKGRKVKRL